MNEEELFCKLFPDYAVNGKPLSPYFDLFESGYEQSENRIEELEKKISILLSCKNCPENKGGLLCQKECENKCLAQKIQFTKELQEENEKLKLKLEALERQTPWKDIKNKSELIKENAELKCECKRCVYTDSPCILSDYGKDRNGICDHFKDVFDEIVELNDELKKWKDEWQEQVQKATDEGYARTLQTTQLTKAKEIIKELVRVEYADFTNGDYSNELSKVLEQSEQFLKECK